MSVFTLLAGRTDVVATSAGFRLWSTIMAGIASKAGRAGVYGFAALGFSQTVWFGVKAMQNHDPSAEVRTKAASKLAPPRCSAAPRAPRAARCADRT